MNARDRLADALSDRYRIERALGAGGMATVYLAEDLKHDRKVAIKVLKPELAAVLGAERFVQEIKTTAALNHPHILPLFDSGTAGGQEYGRDMSPPSDLPRPYLYYVMPYIEGETIRETLDRETQFGIEEAVRITTEVADALDYAHRHGVIHRDIKPENILLHDGRPMVMDFGIALAVSAAAGGRMTETGLSLGTPHYMSPEQATADRDLTGRSDIYSLASVLYEMLTGEPPHMGTSAQQIIMKIVTDVPRPVTELRKSVPPNVSAAIAKALQKLPADRFESAKAFAEALANPAFGRSVVTAAATPALGWRRYAGRMITVVILIAVAAVGLALQMGRRPDAAMSRFSLAFPPSQGLTSPGGTRVAWAPDGRSFVYVGPGSTGSQLWLRPLDALEGTPITGTDGATSPTFSPDGTRIAFVTLIPFSVRIVAPRGGASEVVVESNASGGGVAWGHDDYLYFDGITNLSRIRPDGTGREVVYALDTLQNEVGIAWPEVLPGDAGVLIRTRRIGEDIGGYSIKVADPRTKTAKFLVQGAVARYSPTGHLLYVTADGSLMASRIDLARGELTGSSVRLWGGLGFGAFGVVDLALDPSGSLLYTTDYNATIAEPTWVTRNGEFAPADSAWPDGLVSAVALSPDGQQLAVEFIASSASASNTTIWIKRLNGGPLSPLTLEGNNNQRPTWSQDGNDILYLSDRGGGSYELYRQRADGSSAAQLVASDPRGFGEGFESPDGKWIVLRSSDGACCDILGMRPGVDSVPVRLVATSFRERSPALSPDGRWLAYASDEGGRSEIFVRPFPDVQTGRWQVSTDGGTQPRWSERGDELFFLDDALDMQAVRVATTPNFRVLSKQRLFSAAGFFASPWARTYDVSADGRRFLMLRVGTASETVPTSLVMVQNFLAELKRRVP